MYLSILLAPFMNVVLSLCFGRFLGKKGVNVVTVSGILVSVLMSLLALYEVGFCSEICELTLYNWIYLGNIMIEIGFLFDSLTVIMVVVVVSISFFVHVYSISYMASDPYHSRYMGYLSFFTLCMLVLVTADNLVQLFIGWEGVGVSSYLLISFWYTRVLANKAAIKAMIINRVGDICLLIAIASIFLYFGSSNYEILHGIFCYHFNLKFFLFGFSIPLIDFICLCLFIGAMGKSAQLFLHVWLPDAMEGPTPVSALIHAATMVTAGVFLVLRCSFMFEYSEFVLLIIVLIGSITCFLMGIVGMFQYDIKKIVAYSTCSQLGYMFFACGLSNYQISIFHLFNHAFFKALLFLSMGSIIHAFSDEQDFRRMGAACYFLPITGICVFIGNLALLGIPFLTGFYSKDMLLEVSSMRYIFDGSFSFILGMLAVSCTAFYSARLFYRVFFSRPNSILKNYQNIHESDLIMLIPMIVLSILSIFVGFFFVELFIGVGAGFWGGTFEILPWHFNMFDVEFGVPTVVKILPLIFTFLGVWVYILCYKENFFLGKIFRRIYFIFSNSLLFDKVFSGGLGNNILKFSYINYYKFIEFGILHIISVSVIKLVLQNFYFNLNKFVLGKFYIYIAFIILGMLGLIFIQLITQIIELPFGVFVLLAFIFFSCAQVGWKFDKKNSLFVYVDYEETKFEVNKNIKC